MVTLDIIAKRYGVLPSEIAQGNLDDWNFNAFVAMAGIKANNYNG